MIHSNNITSQLKGGLSDESLVIGSGGREHAIVLKLLESPKVTELWCAPGNGGISAVAHTAPINVMDKEGMVAFAKEKGIEFAVVAPVTTLWRQAWQTQWKKLGFPHLVRAQRLP